MSDNEQKGREERHLFRKSPEGGQLSALLPGHQKPGDEKEPGGAESQVDHRQQAALQALIVQGKESDDDKAQVTDAAEREETAEVRLDQRHDRPIDNRCEGQYHDDCDDAFAFRGIR